MNLHRSWLALAALVLLSACNEDVYRPPAACVADEQCLAPRLCVDGACVDPATVDDGGADIGDAGDASNDTDDAGDGAVDVPPLPDVPPPTACVRVLPRELDFGTLRPGELAERVLRVENCGGTPLDLFANVGPEPGLTVRGFDPPTVEPGQTGLVRVQYSSPVPTLFEGTIELLVGGLDPVVVPVRAAVREVIVGEVALLRVEPGAIDFGAIPQGTSVQRDVFLCNDGGATLVIDGARQVDDEVGVFEVLVDPAEVASGECTRAFAVFDGPPISTQPAPVFRATYAFDSNAEPPAPTLQLTGTVETGGPVACLTPLTPFVERIARPGEGGAIELDFANCSGRPLRLVRAELVGLEPWGFVENVAPPVGEVVGPGERITVVIGWRAGEVGEWRGQVVVSVDGTTSSATVQLSVRDGGGCTELSAGAATGIRGPFSPSLVAAVGQTVYLDPGAPAAGGEVSWRPVEFPTPSAPRLDRTAFEGRVQFAPTTAGDYAFQVRYAGADGCESEGVVVVTVTRDTGVGAGLRFVVTWRTPGDPDELEDPGSDVDLHLLPADAPRSASWNSSNDCYYGNRETSWGARLLRDELDGLGPEIIVLERPALDRDYLVGVYYFSDDGFGPSDVTLRIFRDGVQVATATRRLERTGRFWLAAEVRGGGREIVLPSTPNRNDFP